MKLKTLRLPYILPVLKKIKLLQMKKTIFIVALFIGGLLFQTVNAQISVDLRVNIGTQPVWGPIGYDHVEYYYMPDIDVFYYVPRHQYIYLQRGSWTFATSLPYKYRSYDIYTGYKVVINEARPYRNAGFYRTKYSGYKNNHGQEVIRNSQDSRYFENKGHPQHGKWQKSRSNGKH